MTVLPKALIGPVKMRLGVDCTGLPSVAGIYRIFCAPLGRSYVGQTTDAARRWLEHQQDLWSGQHVNSGLQAAFNLYGYQAFTFSVLERLPQRYHEATYALAEDRWLRLHRQQSTVFNVRPAGTDHWLTKTAAGREAGKAWLKADQAGRRARPQGNFHRRNKDHL